MKLKVKYNQIGNYKTFLRQAGYALIFDRRRGVESFVRRLGEGYYPRIHLYVEVEGDNLILNLHLDQKKASYEGSHMHSAEYDGNIIQDEMDRLKKMIGLEIGHDIDFDFVPDKTQPLSGNLDSDLKRLSVEDKPKKIFWFFKR